ncbi:MAG: formate dehydrogenase accessory sulfurtransferase FdhD [Alcaligenaceae bacterium]|nr:formate dehydrogenase accessory sulfurtransferase FdhD [Alcaligenaceae bacterium]
MNPLSEASVWRLENGVITPTQDVLIQETPVSLVYNGVSHIVLMATPSDLEALALGFSLSEGIIQRASQLYDVEVFESEQGMIVNMEIATQAFMALKHRRRNLQGRTGCGLCGIENLEAVKPAIAEITYHIDLSASAIEKALNQFTQMQPLRESTGSVHAAAWATQEGEITLSFEDVGRHNALDKLIGYAMKHKIDWQQGFVVVSSRASYEMVLKSALSGVSCLVAVSAPTQFAVDLAKEAGLTLVGFARPHRQVIYNGVEHVLA